MHLLPLIQGSYLVILSDPPDQLPFQSQINKIQSCLLQRYRTLKFFHFFPNIPHFWRLNKGAVTLLGPDLQNKGALSSPSLSNVFGWSCAPSPESALMPLLLPPIPHRMVILILGLKPHRKSWILSARPAETVINCILLNGCPSIVVPVKVGTPLLAWGVLTSLLLIGKESRQQVTTASQETSCFRKVAKII